MLYLNSKDIMRAITLDEVMGAVSEAYLLFDKGTCYVPERAFYAYGGKKMLYMPCFSPEALMTKILSYFPENYKDGKPLLDGVILWNDAKSGEILSIAFSSAGQHQDAGAKLVHAAPNTTGQIISKSISKNGGRSSYRGLVSVHPGAHNSKNSVVCDALILDPESRSDTYPYIEVSEQDVQIGHEASVSRIGEEQMFYLMSRGLSEQEASTMIVNGFIEPLVKELPMEYAVEMNRLIQLQMEGSVG